MSQKQPAPEAAAAGGNPPVSATGLDEVVAQDGSFSGQVEADPQTVALLVQHNRKLEELTSTLNLGLAMVRDLDGTISFWSKGCEHLYGWRAEEAVGRLAHELLRTAFPLPMTEIHSMLEREGKWIGDLEQQTRDGAKVIVTAHKALRRDAEGRPTAVLESLVNMTARRNTEARLAKSEEQLRSVVETTVDAILVTDGEGRIVMVNPAAVKMFGYVDANEMTGRDLGGLMPQAEAERHGGYLAAHNGGSGAAAPARAMGVPGRRLMAIRRDGTEFPIEASVASFISGGQRHFTGVVRDVSERHRAEELRSLLSREVDHRAKNALAVALSLLRLTPRHDAAQFAASVEGRVAAMARAHSLLATERWAGADLRIVAKGELSAHAERVSMSGPAVSLTAEAVQPMAMVLHELATNAVKYGALMCDGGRIELSWDREGMDGDLHLRWQEIGGLPVQAPPTRTGFGSRLMDTMIRKQMSGSLRFDWEEQGLCCTVAIPRRLTAPAGWSLPSRDPLVMNRWHGVQERHAPAGVATAKTGAPMPRILMVEDEAMLAMELENTLGALGYQTIGAATLPEAVHLAATEPDLSAAILDVNLGNGELSFPVVDLLQTRGVPYIFATGYGSVASLNGREHGAVAVLIKPYPRLAMANALNAAMRKGAERRK